MVPIRDRLLWVHTSDHASLRQRLFSAADPLTLHDGLDVPHDLAVRGDVAYLATDVGVVSVSLLGATAGLVAADERGAYRVAVDRRYLFWLVRRAGAVLRRDRHSGEVTTLAQEGPWASALASDETHVYWSSAEIVRRVPKEAGPVEVVLRTRRPLVDLVVDGDALWWLSSDQIGRVAKSGGEPEPLVSDLHAPAGLTLGRGGVYWADGRPGIAGARIARLSSWGGPVQTVVARCFPQAIAVRAPHLYWADAAERAILRVRG